MKRKNLITLLAFFPLFSVWGQSSLNPVEKEKLKLPELPQTMLRATAQANEQCPLGISSSGEIENHAYF